MTGRSAYTKLFLIIVVASILVSGIIMSTSNDYRKAHETNFGNSIGPPSPKDASIHPFSENTGIYDCADNNQLEMKSPEGDRIIWTRVTRNCVDSSPIINITIYNRNPDKNAEGVIVARVDDASLNTDIELTGFNISDIEGEPTPSVSPPSQNQSSPGSISGPFRREQIRSEPPSVDRDEYEVSTADSPTIKYIKFRNVSAGTFNVTVTITANFQRENETETFTLVVTPGGPGLPLLDAKPVLGVTAPSSPWVSPTKHSSNKHVDCARAAEPTRNTQLDAEFTYTPHRPEAGETIAFDAGKTGSRYSIEEYHWDFNEAEGMSKTDTISTSPKVTHVYSDSEIYFVNLTVVDEQGNTDSEECPVFVSKAKQKRPIADLEPPTTPTGVGERVWFDASDSEDPDGGEIVEYRWHFDNDGNAECATATASVSRRYWIPGSQNVEVVVEDDEGDTDKDSVTVKVTFSPFAQIIIAVLSLAVGFALGGLRVKLSRVIQEGCRLFSRRPNSLYCGYLGSGDYQWMGCNMGRIADFRNYCGECFENARGIFCSHLKL